MIDTTTKFLFPPRPRTGIQADMLGWYESRGWVAQVKKNGVYCVVWVAPDGSVTLRTRHNDPLRSWDPPAGRLDPLVNRCEGWCVFAAELLHGKVSGGPKDSLYIHDVLVWNGESLEGSRLADRLTVLSTVLGLEASEDIIPFGPISHYVVAPGIWVARTFSSRFADVFAAQTQPEDEGLVLKNPKARLRNMQQQNSNEQWQVKCRHADQSAARKKDNPAAG